jgi:hypothetical protein
MEREGGKERDKAFNFPFKNENNKESFNIVVRLRGLDNSLDPVKGKAEDRRIIVTDWLFAF